MKEVALEAIARMGQRLSFESVERLGAGLGKLLWAVLKSRRELATEAVEHQLQVSRGEAERIARESFMHSGRSFVEIFKSRDVDWGFAHQKIKIADPEAFERVRTADAPVVVATAHMGAWELLTGMLELYASNDVPKAVVVRRPRGDALANVMKSLRTQPNVEIFHHRNVALKVLRVLRKKGMVGFLVDHNCSTSEAVFLPFLRDFAAVNMGPALLALRSKAYVCPVFLLRDGKGAFEVHCEEMLDTRELTGSREERIQKVCEFYTGAVQRIVQRYPEQWFWMHKRWKTQPPKDWEFPGLFLEERGLK